MKPEAKQVSDAYNGLLPSELTLLSLLVSGCQ